ncbi:MAG: hypothetical protein ABSG01_16300 [Anaerolineales bacterium]
MNDILFIIGVFLFVAVIILGPAVLILVRMRRRNTTLPKYVRRTITSKREPGGDHPAMVCPECGFDLSAVMFGGPAPYLCPACAADVTHWITIINLGQDGGPSKLTDFISCTSEKLGFGLQYPRGWRADNSSGNLVIKPGNTETMVLALKEFFSPEIVMQVGAQEGQEGLKDPLQFYKKFLDVQGTNFENYELMWNHVQQLSGGHDALEWAYKFTRGSNNFTTVSILSINQDRVFVLSGTCLSFYQERLEPVYRKVLESLSLYN